MFSFSPSTLYPRFFSIILFAVPAFRFPNLTHMFILPARINAGSNFSMWFVVNRHIVPSDASNPSVRFNKSDRDIVAVKENPS